MKNIVLVAALALSMVACGARVKNVTDLPAGVTQKSVQDYDTAVADLHKIASLTSTVRQGVVDARVAGVFPDDVAYARTLQSLGFVDGIQFDASQYLRTVPNTFGAPEKAKLQQYIVKIQAELSKLSTAGAIGIKNSDMQQTVVQSLNELVSIANLIFSITN